MSEDPTTDAVIATALRIHEVNRAALDRGALSIWTVYDHPTDHPGGFIARRHETGGGTSHPTSDVVKGELVLIREVFARCGLHRMPRDPSDDAKIIESWM